jgi:hypothetical protein
MLSRKALAAMLEAHLRAHPLAAPFPQPRLPTRTGIPRNVRCLAAKAPEEKSWLELAGARPTPMRFPEFLLFFFHHCRPLYDAVLLALCQQRRCKKSLRTATVRLRA